MLLLFHRSGSALRPLCKQFRELNISACAFNVPSFNLKEERKAFLNVLPEVIDCIVTSPKLSQVPEVSSWVKQLSDYTVFGGKLLRGLKVSIGYRMLENPTHYSEDIQHSARVLGWTMEWGLFKTAMGQHLDLTSCYNNKLKKNLDIFTLERYNTIVNHKTSYYSFRLPVLVGLLLVKNGKEKATKEVEYICMELGKLAQLQDDYLDAYGAQITTGKDGTDIQEGKCTWLAVNALKHCNDTQRLVFEEFYGSKDPEHVKRIKQLYDELHMSEVYQQYERSFYDDLKNRIHALPTKAESEFFLGLLNLYYKRLF